MTKTSDSEHFATPPATGGYVAPPTTSIGYRPVEKDVGFAYLWGLLTIIGVAGAQHFYLRKPLRGVIWLLTWGVFGIGTLVDIFTLPSQTRSVNDEIRRGLR